MTQLKIPSVTLCAAVSTYVGTIKLPPQKFTPSRVSSPPTMYRVDSSNGSKSSLVAPTPATEPMRKRTTSRALSRLWVELKAENLVLG